jgi:hypothetical protein
LGGGGFEFTNTIDKLVVDDTIVNGNDVIMVRGCLVYHTFAKTRHSAFCYYYRGKITDPGRLNICAGGSDAD